MARKAHYLSVDEVMEKVGMTCGWMNFVYAFNQLDGVSCKYDKAKHAYRVCADRDVNLNILIDDAYNVIYSKGWC
jgi:ribosome-interacting GTPase 1